MAENLHHDPWRDALQEEQRRCRMPGVMQTSLSYAGCVQEPPPGAVITSWVERSPVHLREDEAVIDPL